MAAASCQYCHPLPAQPVLSFSLIEQDCHLLPKLASCPSLHNSPNRREHVLMDFRVGWPLTCCLCLGCCVNMLSLAINRIPRWRCPGRNVGLELKGKQADRKKCLPQKGGLSFVCLHTIDKGEKHKRVVSSYDVWGLPGEYTEEVP